MYCSGTARSPHREQPESGLEHKFHTGQYVDAQPAVEIIRIEFLVSQVVSLQEHPDSLRDAVFGAEMDIDRRTYPTARTSGSTAA